MTNSLCTAKTNIVVLCRQSRKTFFVVVFNEVYYWCLRKVHSSHLSATTAARLKHSLKRAFGGWPASIAFTLRLLLGRMAIPSFHSRTWTMLHGPPTCAVSVGGTASLALPPLAGSPTATAGVTSIWWPGAGADQKTRRVEVPVCYLTLSTLEILSVIGLCPLCLKYLSRGTLLSCWIYH